MNIRDVEDPAEVLPKSRPYEIIIELGEPEADGWVAVQLVSTGDWVMLPGIPTVGDTLELSETIDVEVKRRIFSNSGIVPTLVCRPLYVNKGLIEAVDYLLRWKEEWRIYTGATEEEVRATVLKMIEKTAKT